MSLPDRIQDRPVGREIAAQQGLADAANLVEGLRVAYLAPGSLCGALGEKRTVGRDRRPVLKPFGELARIG